MAVEPTPSGWRHRLLAPEAWALYCLVAAAAVLVVGERFELDLKLQDMLFDRSTCSWIIARDAALAKALFYTVPKKLSWAFMALLLGSLLIPRGFAARHLPRLPLPRRRTAAFVLLLLGVIPGVVGLLKRYSGVPCPYETTLYCGEAQYVSPLGPRPENPGRRYACFPAAHASGGFALMGLYFLARSRRQRAAAIALGLGLGWLTGGYQMLRGAHFLSHTVVTMLLAWPLAVAVATLSGVRRLREPPASTPRSSPTRSRR